MPYFSGKVLMRRIQLSAFILLCMITDVSAAPGDVPSNTNTLIADKVLPMQGNCGANGAPGANAASGPIDPTVSLWSCPGNSAASLDFQYQGGQREACLYIDNLTTTKTYFVPLRTYNEWDKFKMATRPGSAGSLYGKVQITYGCLAQTVSDTCGKTVSLPKDRNGAQKLVTLSGGKRLTFTCSAPSQCGGWSLTSSTGQCTTNGACGAADGGMFSAQPSSDLCSAGTAQNVSGSGPWSWTCAGSGGGTNASCSTLAFPTNGACGIDNGKTLSNAPVNLCVSGTPSAVSGSGPWSWTCLGSNSGTTASCAVKRRAKLTPDRRPILTPRSRDVANG
jgi:hypothetical protein